MRFPKLLLLIIILATSACAPVGSNENSLVDTQWVLESVGPSGAEMAVIEGSTITLQFGADGQAGGSGGCNSYGGGYQVQDNTLSFTQVNSTLMACADERITQQEQQYFQALETTGRFELTDNRLAIWYDGERSVLNFAKAAPADE